MTFQSVVVKVAIVIFIILMVVMALMMIKGRENKKWPPETPTCPDYWEYDENENKCKDKNKLSVLSNDNTEAVWPPVGWFNKTNGEILDKYKDYNLPNNKCCWSKYNAKIEWDGITNNNKLCKNCKDPYI